MQICLLTLLSAIATSAAVRLIYINFFEAHTFNGVICSCLCPGHSHPQITRNEFRLVPDYVCKFSLFVQAFCRPL